MQPESVMASPCENTVQEVNSPSKTVGRVYGSQGPDVEKEIKLVALEAILPTAKEEDEGIRAEFLPL